MSNLGFESVNIVFNDQINLRYAVAMSKQKKKQDRNMAAFFIWIHW